MNARSSVVAVKLEETSAIKEEAVIAKTNKSGKTTIENLPGPRRQRALDWLNANTDPVTKTGRSVFRRGCNPHCITQLLGGLGTDCWPVVNNVPVNNFTGTPNRFISPGEFYVAGRSDWNPWGPVVPGDYGLVNAEAFQSNQESFHYFVQCGKDKWEPNYQGPHAKGKYLYVGKYKAMPQTDEEVQEERRVFPYRHLCEKSQKMIAKFYLEKFEDSFEEFHARRHERCNVKEIPDPAVVTAELNSLPGWENMLEKEQKIWTWRKLLVLVDFCFDLVPVVFDSYDENLYRELVNSNAANGHVATDYDLLGPV